MLNPAHRENDQHIEAAEEESAALGLVAGELTGDIAAAEPASSGRRSDAHFSIQRELIMKKMLVSLVAATAVIPSGVGAWTAELPIYELMGFPISPHQFSALGSAHVEERSPAPPLTLSGVPASQLQISVLTPLREMIGTTVARLTKAGFQAP